jgi:hypothetical protein
VLLPHRLLPIRRGRNLTADEPRIAPSDPLSNLLHTRVPDSPNQDKSLCLLCVFEYTRATEDTHSVTPDEQQCLLRFVPRDTYEEDMPLRHLF